MPTVGSQGVAISYERGTPVGLDGGLRGRREESGGGSGDSAVVQEIPRARKTDGQSGRVLRGWLTPAPATPDPEP